MIENVKEGFSMDFNKNIEILLRKQAKLDNSDIDIWCYGGQHLKLKLE
jgi:hypothetical protein